jgi:hypothetical protein
MRFFSKGPYVVCIPEFIMTCFASTSGLLRKSQRTRTTVLNLGWVREIYFVYCTSIMLFEFTVVGNALTVHLHIFLCTWHK